MRIQKLPQNEHTLRRDPMSKGHISVQTADIFPIIKKWLYSEHDIFLRELVANASDAIRKRAALAQGKNVEVPPGEIEISIDEKNKTISIQDNGLGMTEEEVNKYINQLAFSGAEEFVQKIKEKDSDIIGKFGLGFYSSFMVAKKVEIETLSMEEDAKACKWSCEGDTEYTFSPSPKKEVGTRVTLYLNQESEEFLSDWKTMETLKKFCSFMPYPIKLKKSEPPKEGDGHWTINDTAPLWKKSPQDTSKEDYEKFYQLLFPMDTPPLFWLRLDIDHPFTLNGILYFPKLNPKMSFQEKNIKLYNKQVFVSDNIKSIIPDFLSLLKGVIDSTDIPLNVSRSSLQGDPNVKKISNYIIKKTAEALKKLFTSDRKRYEEIWKDIGLFVKYGCISDEKFDELMRPYVIFPDQDKKYHTIPEYAKTIPEDLKEKIADKILYVEKDKGEIGLLNQAKELKLTVLEADDHIDPHFLQHCEGKGEPKVKFSSLNSEISQLVGKEEVTGDDMKLKELFQKILSPKEEDAKDVEIQKLSKNTFPAFFRVDEQMKRFSQMAQSMGQNSTFPLKKTLVINPNGPLIQNILSLHKKGGHDTLVEKLCHHVEDLASISGEGLQQEQKDAFIQRTEHLMQELTSNLT